MRKGSSAQQAVRAITLVASILTLIIGIIHLINVKPRVAWPPHKFADDNNVISWRLALFTFAPSVFVDSWTPIVFALWGLVAHLKDCGPVFGIATRDFLNAGLFHTVNALFAMIGYAGGIGIIFSCFGFLAALASLIMAFSDNDLASMEMEVRFKAR